MTSEFNNDTGQENTANIHALITQINVLEGLLRPLQEELEKELQKVIERGGDE